VSRLDFGDDPDQDVKTGVFTLQEFCHCGIGAIQKNFADNSIEVFDTFL